MVGSARVGAKARPLRHLHDLLRFLHAPVHIGTNPEIVRHPRCAPNRGRRGGVQPRVHHEVVFDQPYPDWPSNNVWLKDPDGLLIQLAPSANEPPLATIVRNAIAVPRPRDLPAIPPFRASRVSRLVLPCARADLSASYYHRLLGNSRASGTSHIFSVGASNLILTEGGTQSFRVAVPSFEERSARRTLTSLGITTETTSDRSTMVLSDPDGIAFEIGVS